MIEINIAKKEKIIVLILAGIQFTHILDFVIIMPLGPEFIEKFRITNQDFGILVATYSFSAGLLGFFGGFFSDNYNRKSLNIVLYIGFIIGTFACGLSNNYFTLLISRAITGAFGGILGATTISIIGDLIPEARRGRAMGVVMSGFSIASVIGVPLGLKISNLFSWQHTFYYISLMSVITLVLFIIYVPPIRSHLDTKRITGNLTHFKEILMDKNLRFSLLFMNLCVMGGFTIIPFIAPFFVNNVGISKEEIMYIYLFGGLFTFFTSRFIGSLSDRYGKSKMFSIVTSAALIPILVLTNFGKAGIIPTIILTTIFMILVSGRFVPALSLITSSVHFKYRGSFMSINSCVQNISSGLATTLSGMIIITNQDGSLRNFAICGLVSIFFNIIAILISRKIKIVS